MATPAASNNITLVVSTQVIGEQKDDPIFLLFSTFIPELQELIISQLDYATRSSFAWTCKQYLHHARDFEPFRFADQCAKLGYLTLFAYSLNYGGPFDARTCSVAARHGHVPFLQLYQEKKGFGDKSEEFELTRKWGEIGALRGQQTVLDWLKVEDWKDMNSFARLACAAARGGHAATARHFITKAAVVGYLPEGNHEDEVVGHFANHDHLDAALQFRETAPFGKRMTDRTFSHIFRHAGELNFKPHLIKWARENELTLPPDYRDPPYHPAAYAVHWICGHGAFPMLVYATENGGELDHACINHILDAHHFKPGSAFFECLKFVHETLKLTAPPIPQVVKLPPWATTESMQWMQEHGYQFDVQQILNHYLFDHKIDIQIPLDRDKFEKIKKETDHKLIAWMINQGAMVTDHTILYAACTCNIPLLDFLWPRNSSRSPENPMHNVISAFFSRMNGFLHSYDPHHTAAIRLTPIKRTVQWLLAKGYTWGTDVNLMQYTDFVTRVHQFNEKRIDLLKSFVEELKMPEGVISALTSASK